MNVICFHNPDEENGYLSNWYLSHFTVNGIDFSSMEQFMMYQKACHFHDEEIANDILHTDNVAMLLLEYKKSQFSFSELIVKAFS